MISSMDGLQGDGNHPGIRDAAVGRFINKCCHPCAEEALERNKLPVASCMFLETC